MRTKRQRWPPPPSPRRRSRPCPCWACRAGGRARTTIFMMTRPCSGRAALPPLRPRTAMLDTTRWGILGTGKIAREFAAAFARECGAHASYGSYQALVDAPDVDLVYIASPHPMHAENALMALAAGKGVLCEKAFTINRREAQSVVALALEKQLFLMEAMWTRFMPALAEVRRIVAAGAIGAPTQLTADFGFFAKVSEQHRVLNRELGGGALLDLGIYPLSIACALLGPVESVRASATMGPTGVDVQTGFILKHDNGAISSCACSLVARTPCELTIAGPLGQVRMNSRFHETTSISVVLADGTAYGLPTPYLGNGYVH